jgi:hypothetical protein
MLTMSVKERDRLVVVRQVVEKELTVTRGAEVLGLGRRQLHGILRRYGEEGDRGLIHRALGKRPNNTKSEAFRLMVLERAREDVFYDFGPTLLAEHLGRDPEIGEINPHTLRRWMIDEGLWTRKRKRLRHRRRRTRRSAFGELVQMDTSIHDWLESRSSEEIVLVAMIDDATSRLLARFFPRDTGAANRALIIDYLERFGRMGALYTDRASHFTGHFHASSRRAKDLQEAMTLIRRAPELLDIALIRALSPQAKGWVERAFGTMQDRLLKELRVANVCSLDGANRFLDEQFLPFWNQRYTVEAADPVDAHRPLPRGVDLQRLFADEDRRVIGQDFTFRYRNRYYQIERHQADARMPKTKITIERRLDGSVRYRWRERYLLPSDLGRTKPPPLPKPKPTPKPRRKPTPPPLTPDHPWKRYPLKVGKNDPNRRRRNVASAPAALRPNSPEGASDTSKP